MRRYSSFEEIDRDLRYLKLKSQIDKEELKLGFKHSRATLNESFSPLGLIANIVGGIFKKAFVLKIAESLVGMKTVKEKDMKDD